MNHEEKMIEMLEQLFVGQQELKSNMQGMQSDMQGMQSSMQGMQSSMQQLNQRIAKIEQEHGKKLDALFDGYQVLSEKIERLSMFEAHEEEIATMKIAIGDLSQRVTKLEQVI